MVHASGLLPQANVAALTITAQADLVRLLEDAEFSGNAVTAWSKDVAYAISHEDRTWTVHGTAGSVEAPASEAAQEPTRAHTEVDRVLRNARAQIMGAAALAPELQDELRPRLFALSVADLADQMIIMIEHSWTQEDSSAALCTAEHRAFPVRCSRSAPGLFSPEPLDAGGRLSAWRLITVQRGAVEIYDVAMN